MQPRRVWDFDKCMEGRGAADVSNSDKVRKGKRTFRIRHVWGDSYYGRRRVRERGGPGFGRVNTSGIAEERREGPEIEAR